MKKFAVLVSAVLLVFGFAITDARASLVYNLNGVFNGVSPTSTAPYLTATFTTVTTGIVTLTLQASLETASEFIGEIAFNVASIIPATLAFTPSAGTPGADLSATTQNAQNLNGGGNTGKGFDFLLNFDANTLNDSVLFEYTITASGITEASFNDQTSSGLYIGAHIQGILLNGGTTSGAVTGTGTSAVPIPSAVWLLGSGLIGLVAVRRRFRK